MSRAIKKIIVIENGLFSTYTMRDSLMKILMQEGYEVTVLTHTNDFVKQVEDSGLKVINVGSGNLHPIRVIKYIYHLFSNLKNVRPDLVLTFSIRPAIWGNFVTRYLNIPTITNITGVGPLFTSKNIAYRLARVVYKPALQKTQKVFFQNYDDMELFIGHQFVKREVVERIPGSGVDFEKFIPIESTEKNKDFVFLFIGRLIRDKGIFEFVKAARMIHAKYPKVLFQMLGPLWQQNLKSNTISKAELKSWIDEGIVEYMGETKDVRKYVAQADCIVLPSYREGTSNILLEAASMEKPAITCNTTGCKEIVEDNVTGFLCKVKDSNDLADKMEKMLLLSPEERFEMGKKAREKIIREFDKKIVLTAYLNAIEKLKENGSEDFS